MKAIRDAVLHALLGLIGILFGMLSAVALALAAVVPPILGLIAFVLSPVRAFVEWLRRPRTAP